MLHQLFHLRQGVPRGGVAEVRFRTTLSSTPRPPGLPATVQEWVALYRSRHRGNAPSLRILDRLYRALARGRSPNMRHLAQLADASPATVHRVVARLVALGALRVEGGGSVPGTKGRQPLSYRPLWPPADGPGRGDGAEPQVEP